MKPLPVLTFAIQNPTAMQLEKEEPGHSENPFIWSYF